MSDVDDRLLVQHCVEGRSEAFDQLVERYYKVLFNVALRMVGTYEDAEDITQTAFMKAYEKLETYDPKYKFFSWIYRILINEALNGLKRRRPVVPLTDDIRPTQQTPAKDYEKKVLERRVQEAMMQLSIEQRQVITLRHFGDLTYQEISAVLSVSEKTIKSRLFAARHKLCDILIGRRTAT